MRVVSLEQAVAAPFATRHLADLGAEVIKVERTDGGDFARDYDSSIRGGLATHFAWLNRGKQSIALDLAADDGKSVLGDLLATADVFLHNLGPGAVGRLGFDADTVRQRFPRLIVAELTGYGTAGPMSRRKAYDLLVQAEAGFVSITGSRDAPAKAGIPVADIAAGTYLLEGILAALLLRQRTDAGEHIQVSLFDALVEWMGYPIYRQLYLGSPPPRVGLGHPTVTPYDAYPTGDGTAVLIGIQNDRGWSAFARQVIERPDLVDDPRTSTNIARTENRDFVDDLIAQKTRAMTAAELGARLDAAGIPNGLVNDMAAVVEHPQLTERGRWTTIGSPVGEIAAVLPPVLSSAYSPSMGPVPALGEHTDAVLESIGRDAEERRRLRHEGTVS
ncbi:CoA transferase [Pseudolysinimonas kribbensis]|uniref:CoA transferase n=1 Tax=Pseudolysinimonas kribbensis TaxID=433641 RepID=A0ABQ6K7C9_9MICO|nr:CoA transferase [Pseudolysinimonas kribbensis]